MYIFPKLAVLCLNMRPFYNVLYLNLLLHLTLFYPVAMFDVNYIESNIHIT